MTNVRPELRRKLALAGGLLAIALPALSACGFDYPTDRPNEIIHGGTNLLGDEMRVNAARIVSPSEGKGVFIATITVNPTVNPATESDPNPAVVGLTTAEDADTEVTTTGDFSIPVGDRGIVNLADPKVGGVAVTGDFVPGDIIPMTVEFDQGKEPVTVNVPVVTQCGPYASVVAANAPTSVPVDEDSADTESDVYSCEYPDAEFPAEESGGH